MSASERLRKFAILLMLIALVVSPLVAGVVFQVETTYHSGAGSGRQSSTMSVETPNLKMEILSGSGSKSKDEVIFRGDRREMVVVSHRDKSYMVMDGKTARQMGGQVQKAMKDMEKRLAQMDPKQREMVEKMLKGRMGGANAPKRTPDEFRRTGERATKQGYPCVRYDVLRDGQKVRELWVTDWSNIKGSRQARETFKEMASFFSDLMDSFGKMPGGTFSSDNNFAEIFNRVDGFPVVTRTFEDGQLESETVLESVIERDLDPDAFEPPKGYRLRTMGPQ